MYVKMAAQKLQHANYTGMQKSRVQTETNKK